MDKTQNLHELHMGELLKEAGLLYSPQAKGLVPGRKYVCDFLLPAIPAVIELQGGIWRRGGGAHSSGIAIERDCEKLNLLQVEGYMVYHIPSSWLGKDYDKHQKLKDLLGFLKFFQDNSTSKKAT